MGETDKKEAGRDYPAGFAAVAIPQGGAVENPEYRGLDDIVRWWNQRVDVDHGIFGDNSVVVGRVKGRLIAGYIGFGASIDYILSFILDDYRIRRISEVYIVADQDIVVTGCNRRFPLFRGDPGPGSQR